MIDLEHLLRAFDAGEWVPLADAPLALPQQLFPPGPGVVVRSGGSSGGYRWCLQPRHHLDDSAAATASWLHDIGMDPRRCLVLNPLPMHHVSGLMPWWRARSWGVPHHRLSSQLMKQPGDLLRHCRDLPEWSNRWALLSLVPTQLGRLLSDPAGQVFLREMRVIWVGGASLPHLLAEQARAAGIPLAPCYGATETAAMVTALSPQRFLAGDQSCGAPLSDVKLRLGVDGALEIRTKRLALGSWRDEQPDVLLPVANSMGWWRSGDRAQINGGLVICGRLDTALNCGGETVFPEQLEARLMSEIRRTSLPVETVLFLGMDEPEWGQRLVTLARASDPVVLDQMAAMTADWPASERPRRWVLCPELAPTDAGKWQRQAWRDWLERLDLAQG